MNRFSYDNIDPSVSRREKQMVLTQKVGVRPKHKRPRTTSCIKMATRLNARVQAYNNISERDRGSYTCPGSLNPNKQ